MPKTKSDVVDVATPTKRVRGKGKKSGLRSATTPNFTPNSARAIWEKENPLPEDIVDPVAYAEKYLEKQIPQAARELNYQLKFGDDKTRKEIALEILSFKGITKKSDASAQVVPAVQLIMNGAAPFTQVTLTTKEPSKELVEGTIVNPKEPT